jgi:co-chaperonin GroES (HSP10)
MRGCVLVAVDPDEKSKHMMGDVELFIAKEFSWDGKESNPTGGTLLHDHFGLKAGTRVHFNHRATEQGNDLVVDEYHPLTVYSIEDYMIHLYEDEDGELQPIDSYAIVERLYEPEEVSKFGIILTTEQKQIPQRLLIKKVGKNSGGIKSGQIVITEKYSDYEMNISHNGRDHRVVRLNLNDIVAIDRNKIKYELKKSND